MCLLTTKAALLSSVLVSVITVCVTAGEVVELTAGAEGRGSLSLLLILSLLGPAM